MQDRIKEHDRDIRLARTQTSAVAEHTNNTGHYPLWNEVKFIDRAHTGTNAGSKRQSSVRKKMAAIHLTTIPCEPNTANMAHRKLCFCEILPRTNNIVHARFQVFKVFL